MEITLEDIGLALGGKKILDNVAFTVRDGEFVSLLGASGAGKSTTLRVIAGIAVQDAGRVLFDGTAVDEVSSHKRQTAIVFQDVRLFPHMTVAENVAFPLKMKRVARARRAEVVRDLLSRVHLDGFGSRRPSELSGGQQQRVALARALAAEPRALLLDEPFSGLDENLRGEMRDLVSELHRDLRMTSIMVTHDAAEALAMSDRIVYLSEGRVLQIADSATLCLHPASEAVECSFGTSLVMEGAVRDGVFRSGKFVVDAAAEPDGPAVFVRVAGGGHFVRSL